MKKFYKFMKLRQDLKFTKSRKLAMVHAKTSSKAEVDKYFYLLNTFMTPNSLHGKSSNVCKKTKHISLSV